MNATKIAHLLATAIFAATMLTSIPLVFGFFADIHPAFDSLAHFRAHLAVLVAVGGLVLLVTRFRRQGFLAVALGAAAFWTTAYAFPFGGPNGAAADENAGERAVYRLLQVNVRFDNQSPERLLSLIGRMKPDIVTLEEVSARWKLSIARISAMYPYSVVCDATDWIGGVAILSRRPFAHDRTTECRLRGSFAVATVDFGGRTVDVAAAHMPWPWPFNQPRELALLKPIVGALGATSLLAGDFNATTWSAAIRNVEKDGALKLVAGIGPTWLDRRMPDELRPYIGLPIDQIFSKGEIAILSAKTLESVGSDHLPVLVEFSLTGDGPEKEPERATVATESPRPGNS